MKFFNLRNSIVIGIALVAVGCAQVRGLNGGAKDVTPPKLLAQSIDSFATNVATNTLVLNFDEFVQAGAANEVIVSPALKQPATLICNKRLAMLSWTDTLKANTTYTIEFGNAISDITEGNKASLNFVFSTGSKLDSASLSGAVYDAQKGGVPEKATVVLYSDSLMGSVAYAKKVNEKGEFTFNYLPKTIFHIAAFSDLNENRIWDENEVGDFIEQPVSTEQSYPLNMRLSPKKIEKISEDVFKTDSVGSGFIVGAYGMIDRIRLSPVSANIPFRYGSLENSDTLFFAIGGREGALPNNNFEGVIFSFDQQPADTLSAYLAKSPKLKKFKFSGPIQKNPKELMLVKAPSYAVLKRNSCDITIRGIQAAATIVETNSPLHHAIQIDAAASELTGKGSLRILPGAWETAYGTTNDTLQLNFEFPTAEKLGNLELSIPLLEDKSFKKFVELRNEKGIVVRKVDYAETLVFSGIQPGKYTVRLVHDVNRNGQWDIADLQQKIRCEPVSVFSKPIEVRANWSVTVVLN
ncbi:MAG: hypothetical protein RLZZ71_2291 [Bacteroidota bacterium]|jgi:uncharacterized protein (DUF2141 family)